MQVMTNAEFDSTRCRRLPHTRAREKSSIETSSFFFLYSVQRLAPMKDFCSFSKKRFDRLVFESKPIQAQ